MCGVFSASKFRGQESKSFRILGLDFFAGKFVAACGVLVVFISHRNCEFDCPGGGQCR